MTDKVTTTLNKWIDILDKEKDKIELNVCVFTKSCELIADRPNLSAFYEEAYTNVIEKYKDKIDFLEQFEDDEEDTDFEQDICDVEYIIDEYVYCIIDLYLISLRLEDYAYVFDYRVRRVRWVWLDAVNVTDIADANDKLSGERIYQKIQNQ